MRVQLAKLLKTPLRKGVAMRPYPTKLASKLGTRTVEPPAFWANSSDSSTCPLLRSDWWWSNKAQCGPLTKV
jgi:hypothetical protein